MMLRFSAHLLKSIVIAIGYLLITLSINGFHTHGLVSLEAGHRQCACGTLLVPSNQPPASSNRDNATPEKDGCPACLFLLTAQSDVPAPILLVAWQPITGSPHVEQVHAPASLFATEHPARAPPAIS
jgi:hypothetical protein